MVRPWSCLQTYAKKCCVLSRTFPLRILWFSELSRTFYTSVSAVEHVQPVCLGLKSPGQGHVIDGYWQVTWCLETILPPRPFRNTLSTSSQTLPASYELQVFV